MAFPITQSAVLNGLELASARFVGLIRPGQEQQEWLIAALLRVAAGGAGIVVYYPGPSVPELVLQYVSPYVLALLGYADHAAYAAAIAGGEFVHEADRVVVDAHILPRSTAVYEARFRRGDGSYRRLRLQGGTMLLGAQEIRITAIWPP